MENKQNQNQKENTTTKPKEMQNKPQNIILLDRAIFKVGMDGWMDGCLDGWISCAAKSHSTAGAEDVELEKKTNKTATTTKNHKQQKHTVQENFYLIQALHISFFRLA